MDREKWLKKYRSNKNAIWIRCKLTDGQEFNIDKFEEWLQVKNKCDQENLYFKELYLQYRSHKVELELSDSDGIYLIRSVLGSMGSDTRQYYTFGNIRGEKVAKQMWITPELVIDKEYEDEVENCFEEAIIYDKTKENWEE